MLLPDGFGLNILPCLARWRKRLSLLKISRNIDVFRLSGRDTPSIELPMADVTCLQIGYIVTALVTSQMLLASE